MPTVKIDMSGFKELQKQINQLGAEKEDFYKKCLQNLALRILIKVTNRTPKGIPPDWADDEVLQKYWKGYVGGTLHRGWIARNEKAAQSGATSNVSITEISKFAQDLKVEKKGSVYYVVITNPVHYASFVEYGHRQKPGRFVPQIGRRLKKSWVQGQFMLRISENEMKNEAPPIIAKRMEAFLRRVYQNG